ncbi:unnamed protein product [Brassica oleracea var. botrytis]|uniref:Uncharacterized protein n=2 Tax=Brassica TaxID=3705 RepID=A0A3P6EFJ3_BRAOL|nr:unnamed protein product [Brassica napus]CDY31510.1 BnaC05g16190D [Brassica napus]VDD43107.1 unnamed protein product [Brassica oleracea]
MGFVMLFSMKTISQSYNSPDSEPLLIVFILAVPCHSHESLFGGKTLYAGKELRKETLPLQSGSRVYRVQGIKSSSWYEVKISYPASIPALFSLQLLRNGEMGLKLKQMRRLLNTEKLIFRTGRMYVLVTVEPEGIVAIPNFKERSFSYKTHLVLCLVVAVSLPRFLPSYLLIKDGDRKR